MLNVKRNMFTEAPRAASYQQCFIGEYGHIFQYIFS